MNKQLKIKYFFFLVMFFIISLMVALHYQQGTKFVPQHPSLYSHKSVKPSVFREAVKDIHFYTTIDSIYESKDYNDYIYTETDLLLAKEYRLYVTDKEKLFERIFKEGTYENSILIPLAEE